MKGKLEIRGRLLKKKKHTHTHTHTQNKKEKIQQTNINKHNSKVYPKISPQK